MADEPEPRYADYHTSLVSTSQGSTRGRAARACRHILPLWSDNTTITLANYEWYAGTIQEDLIEEMVAELHAGLQELKADPVTIFAGTRIYIAGAEENYVPYDLVPGTE